MTQYNSATFQIKKETEFFIERAKTLNEQFSNISIFDIKEALDYEWLGAATMLLEIGNLNTNFISSLWGDNKAVWVMLENNIAEFKST